MSGGGAAEGSRLLRLAPAWDRAEARELLGRLEELLGAAPPEAVLHRGRNRIVRIAGPDGAEVVVKRFPARKGIRALLDRFRPPKAVRAFDSAARLVSLGIATPEPFAAAEWRVGGRPRAFYFVSELVAGARVARELKDPAAPGRAELLRAIGAMVGRLHELGVIHRDLTSGNVLIVERPGEPPRLPLVDVNRMSFTGRPLPLGAGLANLVQLRFGDGAEILEGYCAARNLPLEEVRPRYRRRLALRAFSQDLREASRPVRRRLGL